MTVFVSSQVLVSSVYLLTGLLYDFEIFGNLYAKERELVNICCILLTRDSTITRNTIFILQKAVFVISK